MSETMLSFKNREMDEKNILNLSATFNKVYWLKMDLDMKRTMILWKDRTVAYGSTEVYNSRKECP